MEIRPIRDEADYEAALKEIERLFNAVPGTPEADRLDVWVTLVEAYEICHHRIPTPDPIEAIEYEMERRGLARKDLEPYIGSRFRVSEVLNRRRPLSLRMIRQLSAGLGIPAHLLVQEYTAGESPNTEQGSRRGLAGAQRLASGKSRQGHRG
jgi:HTH-type transcriptional regulator / antitoxin HigA